MRRLTETNTPICKHEKKYALNRKQADYYRTLTRYKVYNCHHGNHWHLSSGGHKGRIVQPHFLCDKCQREIRVVRRIKHEAKCTGFNGGSRYMVE